MRHGRDGHLRERGSAVRNNLKAMGKRLRDARVDAQCTQEEIARKLRVSKQLVSHWETGRSEITIPDMIIVAKMYSADLQYLMTGVIQHNTRSIVVPGAKWIGVATHEECLAIARGQLTSLELKDRQTTYADVSDEALRTTVPERAMEPTFTTDMVVTVDPTQKPEPGDCVLIALLASDELLFRRIQYSGQKLQVPPYALKSDNTFFEARSITTADKPVFLGRLIERIVYSAR